MATLIGLTGGIASGKSTVSNILKEQGFTIIDADLAARAVVEPGENAYNQVIKSFGTEILLPNQTLNRAKLGSIIFHDEEKRQILNAIVHPAVRKRMDEWKEEALLKGKKTIIYDIPLLFESNLQQLVEKTIVVYVDRDVQLQRLMDRNHLTKSDAEARIQSQMPLSEKVNLADAVINNNDSIAKTKEQVKQLITKWHLEP